LSFVTSSWRALVVEAGRVLTACRGRGLTLATAESCTGGLVAGVLTEIAGSSDVVERGFVTYSNAAKIDLLGVSKAALENPGAVSEIVARQMAEGARRRARVDLAVSITGIAGPGGATATKPVGLVHIACARRGRPTLHRRQIFKGNRAAIRRQAIRVALLLLRRQAAG
jgi:nicotinamide-nucleotide amidase